jgi:hypothetical protein
VSPAPIAAPPAAAHAYTPHSFISNGNDERWGGLGAVYTATNSPSGDALVSFRRDCDGRLFGAGNYPTGGVGTSTGLDTGAGLGSGHSVIASSSGCVVLAVNAGSNSVPVFRWCGGDLRRLGAATRR